jgi:hypothetical protein
MATTGRAVVRSLRGPLLVLAVTAPFALTAACGAQYGADQGDVASEGGAPTGLLDGAAPENDGASSAAPDATIDAPPPDAGADASSCPLKNLASNFDLENGGVGWLPWNATVTVVPGAARTGSGGIQVCRKPSVSEYDADQKFATALPAGTYYARAWLRADPAGGAANGELYMTDPTAYAATYKMVGQLGLKWTCAEVTGTHVVASFGAGGNSQALGTCVDVDDTALYEVPADGIVPAACKCPLP